MASDWCNVVVDDDLGISVVLVVGVEVVGNFVVSPAEDFLLKPLGLARIGRAINPGMSLFAGFSGVLKLDSGKFFTSRSRKAWSKDGPSSARLSERTQVFKPVDAISKVSSKVLREGV